MHSDKKLVVLNWKTYLTIADSVSLAKHVVQSCHDIKYEVAIAPMAVALAPVSKTIERSKVNLCAQDFSAYPSGAYTGSTSLSSLSELRCKYALIGHSELRHKSPPEIEESNDLLARKLQVAAGSDISPMFCFGETHEQKEKGMTHEVLSKQLLSSLEPIYKSKKSLEEIIFVYEPVWAISSQKTARTVKLEEILEVKAEIEPLLKSKFNLNSFKFISGASVNEKNIMDYLGSDEIDGVIIGKASTEQNTLDPIVKLLSKS